MFKFAIITDTHIRSPDGDLSSPFPVNEKANNRARYAVGLIKQLQPEFVVHLGDMVHPLPHMDAYQDAVNEAHQIFKPLANSIHFVPGNHDIGDKPSPAMPAKPLSSTSEQNYESAFGASRYSFEHQGVVFIVLNSSLVNSGTDAERQQRLWLEEQLSKAGNKRIFLFSHYPPFINSADEVNHYDNYAEPGRSWLLDLAVKYQVEVIFSGHVHQFFYNNYRGVKLVCLPPTSFIRQDYAELFPTSPSAEYGRDDVGKYSVCQIVVESQGFKLNVMPTFGTQWTEAEQQAEQNAEQVERSIAPVKSIPLIPHLRHAWFEARHLPYNGPMEEFGRKLARNDYPLLRLLQLGIDTVRIPLSDLEISEGLQRVLVWNTAGVSFIVFCVGEPSDQQLKLMQSTGSALAGFEMVCINGIAADRISDETAQRLQQYLQCPVSLSLISTSAKNSDPTIPYAHAVSSGFDCNAVDDVIDELQRQRIPLSIELVFQLSWGDVLASTLDAVFDKLNKAGFGLEVNIRLANSSPALANFDNAVIAQRLDDAINWARDKNRVRLQCDTCLLYTSPSPRDGLLSRMPSSA